MTITIALSQAQFDQPERLLVDHPAWRISGMRYASGIAALRIKGARAEVIVLPWRGQQVWSLRFDGEDVGMRRMTDEPAAGSGLLDSFGAFFFHCGLMGTSAPGPMDSHAQHGELPVGALSEAWLELCPDSGAITVRGRRHHAQAFRAHYIAEPFLRMLPDQTEVTIGISVCNAGHAPMPFMYMGHPNFRPVDGAQLAWSGVYDAASVRLHTPVQSAPTGTAQRALLDCYRADPLSHRHIQSGLAIDPEAVFQIDYRADEQGWAHSLQIHPDGSSDAVAHQVAQCPRGLRWICRQPDMDAIAIVEPATSWLGGYTAERAAGHVPELAPAAVWQTEMQIARLTPDATAARLRLIDRIGGRTVTP